MTSTIRISAEGDCAVRVALGEAISPAASLAVSGFADAVVSAAIRGVVECVPAYCSVLVVYNPRAANFDHICSELTTLTVPQTQHGGDEERVIPVCYGGEFGQDLEDVASYCGLNADDVGSLHAAAEYSVACVGFVPGFAYLIGLPERLAVPRLPSPRVRVPAGSVAIGGSQTGVYPLNTPGGWRLIGRTPLLLFDAQRDPPALLGVGDTVRFRQISHDEYDALSEGNGQ